MSIHDITLLRPLWLLLLPVLGGFGWWLWSRSGGFGEWDRATNPVLMRAMATLGRIDASVNRTPLVALLVAMGICILALSGPAIERRDAQSFRNLDGVLFVVDASSSVTDDPRWPQMLTMGRFGVSALGTRPGGIIVYAGDAYVATDMTADHRQVGQTFSLIDAQTVPDRGSRPERALALAGQLMREADVLAGDVVLFTDGVGLGPASLQEAAALAEAGTRLSVVSLSNAAAGMETHASVGGGAVFTLEQTDDLQEWLASDAGMRLEQADYPVLFWRDMGRYLLVLALVPLLLLFRRDTA
ncbi:VWA domain-containing protein [Ruegeria sp. 2205SS24-7]|uniref:vWA domain-containing protein n=1 Tax=Ruegeria discodermiae TaxID=3064389 RepID=UPI002740CFB2|nr:vWA domain-containing protein [Ruegeria sp. 2205SS24-7]MDP5217058.1 VWA domain-containing protein [Ruegeria sp. 2205SS24-7]